MEEELLFWCEKDGEVGVILGQDVDVNLPFGFWLSTLLHHKSAKEGMLG